MKNVFIISFLLLMAFAINGCKKDEPAAPDQTGEPAAQTNGDLVPIPLVLPDPMTVGTQENIEGVENLKKPLGKPRPVPLAPKGVENLAFGKPVTSSEMEPIMGELEMIVDGDKNATDNSVVELGLFKQWVQIDLEDK